MRINLKEIPKDGEEYIIDQKTGELNEILADLLKGRSFDLNFRIAPLGPGQYELAGHVKTELTEDCSRCGDDMNLQIDRNFKELLLPALDKPKDAKYSKPNHFSEFISEGNEGDLSVSEYRGHHFNMGDYVHEMIAISIPFNPAPVCDSAGRCSQCKLDTTAVNFGYEDRVDFEPEKSPFEVLKKLK